MVPPVLSPLSADPDHSNRFIPDDAFASLRWKLQALFGLTDEPFLVLGGDSALARRIAEADTTVRAGDLPPTGTASSTYSLILWGAGRGKPRLADIAAARDALTPAGVLLIECVGGRRAAHRQWLSAASLVTPQFARVETFRAHPTLDAAETFVDVSSEKEARRLLWRLLPPASQYLVVASQLGDGGIRTLEIQARRILAGKSDPRLVRFALRDRGTLIAFMADATRGERHICRITTSDLDFEIRKNADWLQRLQSNAELPARIKALIPVSVGRSDVGNRVMHLEQQLEGEIAWRPGRRASTGEQILRELCAWALEFNVATAKPATMEPSTVDTLLHDYDLVSSIPAPDEFRAVRQVLAASLSGGAQSIVWAHGDFGLGNALVDGTHRLTGVIDWDCAREVELAGVDLLNAIIQAAVISTGREAGSVLTQVAPIFAAQGFAMLGTSVYDDYFELDATGRSQIVALACLRLAARRYRYPSVAKKMAEDTVRVLDFGRRFLESHRT
jgi:hypothetical protein